MATVILSPLTNLEGFNFGFSTLSLDAPSPSAPIDIPGAIKTQEVFSQTQHSTSSGSYRSSPEIARSKLLQAARCLKDQSRASPLRPTNVLSDSLNDIFAADMEGDLPSVLFKQGLDAAKRACAAYNLLLLNHLPEVVPCTKKGKVHQLISRKDLDVLYAMRQNSVGSKVLVNSELCFKVEIESSGHEGYKISHNDTLFQLKLQDTSCAILQRQVAPIERYLDKLFVLVEAGNDLFYFIPQFAPIKLSKDLVTAKERCQVNGHEYQLEYIDEAASYKLVPISLHSSFLSGEYIKVFPEGIDEEMLVDKSFLVSQIGSSACYRDHIFSVAEVEDGLYQLEREPSEIEEYLDEPFTLLKKRTRTMEICPQSACLNIFEDGEGLYASREGVEYRLQAHKGDTYQLIAKDVPGHFQEFVKDIYLGEGKSVLDIRTPSDARAIFYERICMESFIRAFIAMILLRHEDGKIARLDESNFIFERITTEGSWQGKLRPIIIDLDDALPPTNLPKKDGTHRVRNGLMGFPQVRKPLNADERQQVRTLLSDLLAKAEESYDYIKQQLGHKEALSYKEVLIQVQKFKEQVKHEFTLEELFFFIFADYKNHWQAFSKVYSNPHEVALLVGERPPSQIRL